VLLHFSARLDDDNNNYCYNIIIIILSLLCYLYTPFCACLIWFFVSLNYNIIYMYTGWLFEHTHPRFHLHSTFIPILIFRTFKYTFFKCMIFVLLLNECPRTAVTIQTYIFQIKTPVFTTNYLANHFLDNFNVSI